MSMSQAVQIKRHGGPEVLNIVNVEVGPPRPGEVLIEQRAIGLNYIDIYHRSGLYPLPLPLQLGMEAAGVVAAVGAGVEHLQVGDRVAYASAAPGSYGQQRRLSAMPVCRLPDQISFEVGAAMMLKGLTAQYLLRRMRAQDELQAGDFVLLHAAAGGVGLIMCQWARALGLQLIGTAGSDDKCALALAHGASFAINYQKEDFVARVGHITGGQGVKVVYDSVGKDTVPRSLDCLRPFGLLISFGNASGRPAPLELGLLASKGALYVSRPTLASHASSRERTQAMADELFAMVLSGEIKIRIGQRFALCEAALAHQALERRQTTGCTVLLP